MLDYLVHDIRYAARQLARAPLFTTVSALSLGVGITIAVLFYSYVNSSLFKPWPYADPDRVVVVRPETQGGESRGSAYADLVGYQHSGVFTGVVAERTARVTLSANQTAPARHPVEFVSPGYFYILGVRLMAGRTFSPGALPEIIISETYRERTFQRGEEVIGRTIRLNSMLFTIIGVANTKSSTAGWAPAALLARVDPDDASVTDHRQRYWLILGRLAPGVSPQAANARLSVLANVLARNEPTWRDGTRALSIRALTREDFRRRMLAHPWAKRLPMMGFLVAVVVLLACTNVAGLLLARSVARRHEVAVRLTLGASRVRIASQFTTEALMLGFAGGAVGWFGAWIATKLLARTPAFEGLDLVPDWRVMLWTGATCIGCSVAFGMTPLTQTLRTSVTAGLAGLNIVGERGSVRGRLVALQVCVSCLLVVIGLHASRGVRSQLLSSPVALDGLIVADLGASDSYDSQDSVAVRSYSSAVRDVLRSSPLVLHTVPTMAIPHLGNTGSDTSIAAGSAGLAARYQKVTPEYFETLGIQALRGRLPGVRETSGSRRVALVNTSLIKAVGRDPVGTTVSVGSVDLLVTGVIGDIDQAAADPKPRIYEIEPAASADDYGRFVVARVTPGSEPKVMEHLVRGMSERHPGQVPPGVTTLRSRLESTMAPQRYIADFAFAFGAVELALAAVGLYSLLLYAMLTRTREIGLRMALGARPAVASFAIMKDGLLFIGAGTLLGIAVCIPATMMVARTFAGAKAGDVLPVLLAVAGIALATLCAAFAPARRAARVEPMAALRYD